MKNFVSVRNYLMMYLCIDNASRTGAIANMTVKEFSKASKESNVYRVHIFDHKTVATSGPCVLVFTSSLYNEANIFLNRFRNKLEGLENQSSFFTSWNGKKLASFMVTTQLNTFWGKAVGHTEDRPRFNATMVRKFAVTKVHNQKPEMKKNLALLMCHSDQTAIKSYYLQEKTKNACKTSTSLRSLLRTDEPSDDLPKSQAEIDEIIVQIFKTEIEKRKISMTIVREKKTEELSSLMTAIDLRDRILHIIRNQKKGVEEHEEQLLETQESEYIPTTVSSLTSNDKMSDRKDRVKFSSEDNRIIMNKFGMLITSSKLIKSVAIKKLAEEDDSVNSLVQKFGLVSIVAKVRTERKKFLNMNM